MLARVVVLSATLIAVGCGRRLCPDDMVHDRQRSRGAKIAFCLSRGDASRSIRIEHYDSKQPKEICPFLGPRPGGDYQAWHRNGARFLEGRYENGVKAGRWTQWSPEGNKVGDGEYRDGQLIQGAPVGTPARCETVTW